MRLGNQNYNLAAHPDELARVDSYAWMARKLYSATRATMSWIEDSFFGHYFFFNLNIEMDGYFQPA